MIEPIPLGMQVPAHPYQQVQWEPGHPQQQISAGTPTLEREPDPLQLDLSPQNYPLPVNTTPPEEEYPWIVPYQGSGAFTAMASNDIGFSDFFAQITFVFPYLQQLSFTPRAGMTFIDGSSGLGIPSTLYSFSGQLLWWQQPGEQSQWGYQLALEPGVYTDFDTGSSEAFRLQGRAVGIYASSPETQWLFGLAYINREDLPILPVLGVIWNPDEETKIEFLFPRPRYKRRISRDAVSETWVWIGGEFGGGTWAIDRAVIGDDLLTYSDWRLLVGLERKVGEKLNIQGEIGYVFNRSLEFDSGVGDFDPDSTFLFRLGASY